MVGVWRDEDEVRIRDVLRGLSARALVWGDVDPHGCGLGARDADGSTIVVEVLASALFECQLILPEVVMTAGRKKTLRSL